MRKSLVTFSACMVCAAAFAQHTMTFHDLAFLGRGKRSSSTFSPTNIVNYPAKAWYIGDNFGTNYTWPDATTNNYTLDEKPEVLSAPVKSTSTLNGHYYVTFTNNYLENTDLITDTTNSLYIVFSPTAASWPAWEYIVGCPTNSGVDFEVFAIDSTGPYYAVYAGGDFLQSSTTPVQNEWSIFSLDCQGTNFNMYYNNTNVLSDWLESEGKFTGIGVGASGDTVEWNFRGHIAEIIVYDSIIPGSERTNIFNYLLNKYGL